MARRRGQGIEAPLRPARRAVVRRGARGRSACQPVGQSSQIHRERGRGGGRSRRPNQGPCARPPLPAKPLAECAFGAEIAFTSAYPDKSSEPPVRIELTTARLQGE